MNKILLQFTLFAGILVISSCTSEQEPFPDLCENAPTVTLVGTTQASCNQSNGSLNVLGVGGNGDLVFSLNGGVDQVSSVFNNLNAGSYLVTVTDESGCSSELTVNVINSDGLNIQLTVVGTECNENEGSIIVVASEANGDVEYKLNEGVFQNSNNFTSLPQGGYTITTRDASGCEIVQEVDVKTDVTFGDVELIIQTNCVVEGCHNGNQTPDLRGANNIIGSSRTIKMRTGNRTMPAGGGSLTDEEIATIACWVDDGASGN